MMIIMTWRRLPALLEGSIELEKVGEEIGVTIKCQRNLYKNASI